MAQYAVQITKGIPFQGGEEQFSNVYTLDTGTFEGFDDVAAINRLVALEKSVHHSSVRFIQGKSYGIAGPSAGNVMREILDLTGNGSGGWASPVYSECAILIEFTLPRSLILRRRRVGRKWLHVGAVDGSAAAAAGQEVLPQTMLDAIKSRYATPLVTEQFGGGTFASSSDPFTNPVVKPFLEHRQFHRGT